MYRQLVPKTGPLWPVGRDLALQWGIDQVTPVGRLWSPELSAVVNPEAQLSMQLLDKHFNSLLSAFVSRESLQCLELAAVANGVEPFLTGDSWSSQWLLSLSTAFRGLDESELERVLAVMISDAEFRDALVQSLALLRKMPDAPVQEVVPLIIDRFFRAASGQSSGESVETVIPLLIDQFWARMMRPQIPNGSVRQRGQILPAAYYLMNRGKDAIPRKELPSEGQPALAATKKLLAFETPGFGQWIKRVAAMPSKKQVAAVAQELKESSANQRPKACGSASR